MAWPFRRAPWQQCRGGFAPSCYPRLGDSARDAGAEPGWAADSNCPGHTLARPSRRSASSLDRVPSSWAAAHGHDTTHVAARCPCGNWFGSDPACAAALGSSRTSLGLGFVGRFRRARPARPHGPVYCRRGFVGRTGRGSPDGFSSSDLAGRASGRSPRR
jgi:hypothetical protein